MVEYGKYDLVMKICRESLYMTAEGSKGDFSVAKKLIMSSGYFQNQVLEHLSTQIGKGNFKTSQSVTNELEKQQSSADGAACYGFMNTLFHYLEEDPVAQLARLTGPGPTASGDVKNDASTVIQNLTALALAMSINLSRK